MLLRELMAETAALRHRGDNARERASHLVEESHRLIHIAKNLRWGLMLRYGRPQLVKNGARWTIAREHLTPLTLKLSMEHSAPSTLWIFDPHCTGTQTVQSIKLKTARDAEDAWALIKSHLAVA